MTVFAKGGLVKNTKRDDSIKVRLSPGTVFIKKSTPKELILPFINITDTVIIIDDDEFDRRFPRL